jgi:hypothetical protein
MMESTLVTIPENWQAYGPTYGSAKIQGAGDLNFLPQPPNFVSMNSKISPYLQFSCGEYSSPLREVVMKGAGE